MRIMQVAFSTNLKIICVDLQKNIDEQSIRLT